MICYDVDVDSGDEDGDDGDDGGGGNNDDAGGNDGDHGVNNAWCWYLHTHASLWNCCGQGPTLSLSILILPPPSTIQSKLIYPLGCASH